MNYLHNINGINLILLTSNNYVISWTIYFMFYITVPVLCNENFKYIEKTN